MDKKLLGFTIVFIGIVLLVGIVYFFFFRDTGGISGPAANEEDVIANLQPSAGKTSSSPASLPQKPEETTVSAIKIKLSTGKREVGEADLQRMAAAFAERYGSYSNQSGYKNIDELDILMTAKMSEWSKKYIAELKRKGTANAVYYGINTKAISTAVNTFDKASAVAEVLVKTQRTSSTAAPNNSKTFYQDIIIGFEKENDIWKVSRAYWQE
jgi:hypothetical protein